jgi:hypothetical protein
VELTRNNVAHQAMVAEPKKPAADPNVQEISVSVLNNSLKVGVRDSAHLLNTSLPLGLSSLSPSLSLPPSLSLSLSLPLSPSLTLLSGQQGFGFLLNEVSMPPRVDSIPYPVSRHTGC